MTRARLRFRQAGWVTLSFGLAWTALTACGSTDDDLFDAENPVRGEAGDQAGGEPNDGAGARNTGGKFDSGEGMGGAATGGEPTQPAPTGGVESGTGGSGGAKPCEIGGRVYAPGESFKDDCNTCSCVSGDEVRCTLIACPEPQGGAGGEGGGRSCDDITADVTEELASIQSCESDDECGQVLQGTSCGCTRNLVARKDADISRFEALNEERNQLCEGLSSTCDCPAADGFKCTSNRCGWNYVNERACVETAPAELCLKRDEGGLGATLKVGQKLSIVVQPKGCFSSSCTETEVAACSLSAKGDDFVATAEFCIAEASAADVGCTADCGGADPAECQSEITLTEGKHTVSLGDLSLTFEVPGTLPEEALCVGQRF